MRGRDIQLWFVPVVLLAALLADAAPPCIYNVAPDTMLINNNKDVHCTWRVVTGANFDTPGLEVWAWQPSGNPEPVARSGTAEARDRTEAALTRSVRESVASIGKTPEEKLVDKLEADVGKPATADDGFEALRKASGGVPPTPPRLPDTPPTDLALGAAQKLSAGAVQLWGTDRLAAAVPMGSVVWVRNRDGWSKPYLLDVARVFWKSDERVRQGERFQMAGFGIAADWGRTLVAFRSGDRTVVADGVPGGRGTSWYGDRYVRFCRVPPSLAPGPYELFVHNGFGGGYGWVPAGKLEVLPAKAPPVRSVDARDHGAKGDGVTDNTAALQQALAAVAQAGGGELFLAPGTYCVSRTLRVAKGVTLRGAGVGLSVVQWLGAKPAADQAPEPLVELADSSGLRGVTVNGAGRDGTKEANAAVRIPQGTRGVKILECELRSAPAGLALSGEVCAEVRVADCTFYGAVQVEKATRLELVSNLILQAAWQGVWALRVSGRDCLVDSNVVRDGPGLFSLQPLQRSIVRYNEFHGGPLTATINEATTGGAPESNPWRGDQRVMSTATGGTAQTLVDTGGWVSFSRDALRGAAVLIVAGPGFGQYRIVESNTIHTLTVDRPWTWPPEKGSRYLVAPLSTDTAFHYNYYDGVPVPPFTDAVGLVCEQENYLSGGPIEWRGTGSGQNLVGESAARFSPAWYNRTDRCWFNGSMLLLGAWNAGRAEDRPPPVFGNIVSGCRVHAPPNPVGPGKPQGDMRPRESHAGIRVGAGQGAGVQGTILIGNLIDLAPVGIEVEEGACDTYENDNMPDINAGAVCMVDHGTRTVQVKAGLWLWMQLMEWPGHTFWYQNIQNPGWPYFPKFPKVNRWQPAKAP